MRLSKRSISALADMVCGNTDGVGKAFRYRSSTHLTQFFSNCDLDFVHDGSTRKWWVSGVLTKLNEGPASQPSLPPDGIVRVIQELLDPSDFEEAALDRGAALAALNRVIARDGAEATLDGAGRCHVRSLDSQATSASMQLPRRTWSKEEVARRAAVSAYLDRASEDEFIDNVLVPMFAQLGFRRVSVVGHKDKALEYGKDVWMKYQLPTANMLYFGVQVKRGKLDAAAKTRNDNIAEVLNQVRMMLDHPIWDPETNKQHLPDHVFIACGGEITKQAKNWLGQHLDKEGRRHVLFLDREDILNLALGVNLRLSEEQPGRKDTDEIPF